MHRARAFLFVCAGLFLLALAYHLGARSAGAQVGTDVECVGFGEGGGFAVVNHHVFETKDGRLNDYGHLPCTARAVACGSWGVVFENGVVTGVHGEPIGQLPFSSVVPAQFVSIGQLKAKYAK